MNKIEELLNGKNLTRKQFGEAVGVSQSAVRAWVTKDIVPSKEIRKTIISLYNLPEDYFDGDTLGDFMHAADDRLYYIAADTAHHMIVTPAEFWRDVEVWNAKSYKETVTSLQNAIKKLDFSTEPEDIQLVKDKFNNVKCWKKFQDRRIKEKEQFYSFIRKRNEIRIWIEGGGVGSFWDREEYEKWAE